MKSKIIDVIKTYFPKKEILETTEGFQIENHINDCMSEGKAKIEIQTAYYEVSYSGIKRKTNLYKISFDHGESSEPIVFYIELQSAIRKNTVKRMLTDIANIDSENTVQVDTEGRKGLALVSFCAHTIEKEIAAIPANTPDDKAIQENVIEGLRTIIRNFLTFREAADGIAYLKNLIEENTKPITSFAREVIDLNSVYEQKNKLYGDSVRKEYEQNGDMAVFVQIKNKVNRIETLLRNEGIENNFESLLDSIEDLANYSIIYASLKKFE